MNVNDILKAIKDDKGCSYAYLAEKTGKIRNVPKKEHQFKQFNNALGRNGLRYTDSAKERVEGRDI